MTDAPSAAPGGAPAPSAPAPAPAPASHPGLAIETSPVNLPNPLGPQAPDAPVGDIQGSPHRPQSRREVIAAAFKKAEAERAPTPPAKAQMGHNQPPEPMERERPKPKAAESKPSDKPLNLRQRPEGKPAEPPAVERPRGDHGHFAPRPGGQPQSESRPAKTSQGGPYPQLPREAPYAQPPQRLADHAKREWAATPESVRGEVYRMGREFQNAYQQLAADRAEMDQLRPFQQLAKQHGVTLAWAFNNYKTMEDRLRTDMLGGLEQIVWNANLRTSDGRRITFRDLCFHVASQTPEQHRAMQTQNQQYSLQAQLEQQRQQMAWLAEQNRRMQHHQRYVHMRQGVERFAATHPRLDELGTAIEQELKFGFNLAQAYARANALYPPRQGNGTQAAQTRTQSAQTRRQPNRSISGAPDGGSRAASNGAHRNGPVPTRREALANAFRQAAGGL